MSYRRTVLKDIMNSGEPRKVRPSSMATTIIIVGGNHAVSGEPPRVILRLLGDFHKYNWRESQVGLTNTVYIGKRPLDHWLSLAC